MRLGNSTIFKSVKDNKVDGILTNSYKFITYETNNNETAHNFYNFMQNTFPDMTLMNNSWMITGTFPKGCVEVKNLYADKV